MQGPVSVRIHGRIAIAEVDHPPVNALSHGVRAGLWEAVERVDASADLDALVIICAGRTFFSGADIKEFGKPAQDPQLPQLIDRIEQAAKPVIAAIHGKALGGGLELALGCHARVALSSARIGLPEVKLGLVPGAGGTQRLPRLIGFAAAVPIVAEGGEVPAPKALELGALDVVVADQLEAAAVAHAEALVASAAPLRRTRDLPAPEADAALVDETRKALAKKKRGHTAPQAAIDAILLAQSYPFDEALHRENALCRELMQGAQSKALRHLFAAEREVARVPGLEGVAPRSVSTVGVVGTGTMGAGIVQAFANAGFTVTAVASSEEKASAATGRIAKAYAALVSRGSLAQDEADRRMARISVTAELASLANADLVVETVTEDLARKQAVFAALGSLTRPGTVLASNTSYLDIDTLAAASGRPADVCGMHFFNPANVMRLLENVRGKHTAPEVLATVMDVGKRIGKLPIMSGVCEGFVVNRLLGKRSREGFFMLEEGATPGQIDKVLTGFGFPMGPYALSDLAGIDLQYAARQVRMAGLTEREKRADFVDQLYALGRYGQKTGAGWYRYGEDRKPQPDPAIAELLKAHAEARGITPREVTDQEVLERCLYAMVNEGAKLLGDGIVARPHEVDIAMVNAIGWPDTTGGPLWWADAIGLPAVREAMLRHAQTAGAEYWSPAPLIERLVAEGKGFYG